MDPDVRLPTWMADFLRWEGDLRSELAELPATLRLFRESVGNMQRITKRLLDATEGLEQLTALSTEMLEARRRLDEAAGSLRGRLANADRAEPVSGVMADLGDAVSAMADLNPFLRRPSTAAKPPKPGRQST